jgi:hypothetical protein
MMSLGEKTQEDSGESHQKLGSRIAGRFRRVGLLKDLPELRGAAVRAAEFES